MTTPEIDTSKEGVREMSAYLRRIYVDNAAALLDALAKERDTAKNQLTVLGGALAWHKGRRADAERERDDFERLKNTMATLAYERGREIGQLTKERDALMAVKLPSAEVNALPSRVRAYIAALETECDPSGTIRENFRLREENAGLRAVDQERERERDEARRMLEQSDKVIAGTLSLCDGMTQDEWMNWCTEACERHRAREAGKETA